MSHTQKQQLKSIIGKKMFPKHLKITNGYVVQEYITLPNGTMVCQQQSFIAGEAEYSDMADQILVPGDDIDVDKEVYCPFNMQQPKQIPDPDKEAVFTCPACEGHRLEAVLDGSHTTAIEAIWKGGGIEYGNTE